MPSSARPFSPWLWLLTLVAFPVAGLVGRALGGPVDAVGPALLGGVATGAVVGVAQGLAARGRLGETARWAAAMAVGYGAGLTLGAALVGYGTSTGELAAMGAASGVLVGGAGALALRKAGRPGARFTLLAPALLALGWIVTSLAGVDVEEQYTVFGASGALVVTALGGLALSRLGRVQQASADHRPRRDVAVEMAGQDGHVLGSSEGSASEKRTPTGSA